MTTFATVWLVLLEETVPYESVGFGEFSLRVGVGMTALVVFIALCCLAWRTVPALKQIIPVFIESKSSARSGSKLRKLNPATDNSNSLSSELKQGK